MIGSIIRKMNIICKRDIKSLIDSRYKFKSKPKRKNIKKQLHNSKTFVKIDGFNISRRKRITVCSMCAKTSNCSHTKNNITSTYVCTSAGYWYDTKKKYKWKIMGRYRLVRLLKKNISNTYCINKK